VQGIQLLESFCQKVLTQTLAQEGIRYKVEVKNQFSEIVQVVTRSQLTPLELRTRAERLLLANSGNYSVMSPDTEKRSITGTAKPGRSCRRWFSCKNVRRNRILLIGRQVFTQGK
jgi:hypothetical protein